MEHLNHVCKTAFANLGTNKTPSGLHCVGRCVGILNFVMLNKELAVTETSGTHSLADSSKDKKIIMQHLLNAEVFAYRQNREHKYFQNVEHNIISKLDKKKDYTIDGKTHTHIEE